MNYRDETMSAHGKTIHRLSKTGQGRTPLVDGVEEQVERVVSYIPS
jgi:hypothetical protein